ALGPQAIQANHDHDRHIRLRGGRHMRSKDCMPDNIIFGTVYIGNENADEIIDFTKADLTYICKQVFNPQKSKTT
ncbi:MAG: hypothetical protein ACKPKO_00490, partial [Candidatus Fonsibacter sp.]